MDFLFLIFNTFIFIQYTTLLSHWGITRSAEKYIFAFLLLTVQIIASLLFLGSIGYLYPLPAILFNIIIILSLMFLIRPRAPEHLAFSKWSIWKIILAPLSNKIILITSIIVLGWLLLCAYFLPPRTVDDISYHLPFIYESIQRGHWVLLPTNLRLQFAYPMNAEVFYAWPVLYLNDTRWVGACQIPIGIWTSGVIYLFARHFGINRTKAFLLSEIFILTPIVIAQMGTNYTDLTSAGFLLSSLYLTIRFLKTSKKIYVRLTFLSIGAMMGIKYPLLCWGIVLSVMLLIKLIHKKWIKDILWGIFLIISLGLGWYIRNYLVFSDWIYPCSQVSTSNFGLNYPSVGALFASTINKISLIFLKGMENGTTDGGLGRYYGFLILINWILFGWKFLFRKDAWKKGEFLLSAIAFSFLLTICQIKTDIFPWLASRTLLAAWPIFIITFGRILFILNKNLWLYKLILIIFFLGFIQDTLVVVHSRTPHHHWFGKSKSSKFESYRYSGWYIPRFGPCASELDVLTRQLPRRATVYLVTPSEFFSAPFYGSYLQTQIINFDPDFKGDPDFLVYLPISPEPLIYVGKYKKTLDEAISSSNYLKVFSSPTGKIFANCKILKLSLM